MKRFHVNLKVKDLPRTVELYTALFGADPTVLKTDYAKWMLEDPRINFAISTGKGMTGVEHLGIQAESKKELEEIYQNLRQAKGKTVEEGETHCCYAHSEKAWIKDPNGIEWEAFYTSGHSDRYGKGAVKQYRNCL